MADGNITVEVSTQAAQAELERLRAENAALKHDLQYARDDMATDDSKPARGWHAQWQPRCDCCGWSVAREAADEIERLRDALRIASAAMGDLLRTGKEAAEVLRTEADALRYCSTVDGTWDGTEPEAQEEYERFMALADRLTPPMLPPNAELSGPRPLAAEGSRSNDVLAGTPGGKD